MPADPGAGGGGGRLPDASSFLPPGLCPHGSPTWNALPPLPTRPGPALLSGVLGACEWPAQLLQGPTPHGVSQEREFPER